MKCQNGYYLGNYGKANNGIDGINGKLTINAIKYFQKCVGLESNGDLTLETLFALNLVTKATLTKDEVIQVGTDLGYFGVTNISEQGLKFIAE